MAEASVQALVKAIHSSPSQAVLYLAGGASQAIGLLISVPGASTTVLEAVVPYSRMSMVQLLGKIPSTFCSRQTAEEMALVAYNRGLKLSRPGCPVLGVGFTGSLASATPKHGDHRIHMAIRTSDRLWASTVTFSKGLRNREQEDKLSSHLLLKKVQQKDKFKALFDNYQRRWLQVAKSEYLKAIADACKVKATFSPELVDSEVPDECEKLFSEDEELDQLISGEICFKAYPFSNEMHNAERKIILPGSFNPLHDGHLKLLKIATSICGDGYPCFEISAINADKPPLSMTQIKDRVKQFEKVGKMVIVSNQPYFYKKAELFPGSAFVIGADTVARLINPKYYEDDYKKMLSILIGCKSTGCTFLVGGRNVNGVFKVLEDFDIPEEIKDMFVSIPEDKFHVDISSTELRNKSGL